MDLVIISLAEARALGLKRYFTGVQCKRGHISERVVNGRGCCLCRGITDVRNSARAACKAAIDAGQKTYFTGRPCLHGHVSERCVVSKGCLACQVGPGRRSYKGDWERRPENREKRLVSGFAERRQIGSGRWKHVRRSSAKARAERDGVPFDVVAVDELLTCPPTYCEVFGTKFGLGDYKATIDRLRPSNGYVRGNIRLISARANRGKSDLTAKEHGLIKAYMERYGLP